MFPRCCPWMGRLVVLAVLAVGLGIAIGCSCDSCSQPSTPPATNAVTKDFGTPPENCPLTLAAKKAKGCEDYADCKNGACETCPLCAGKDEKQAAADQVALANHTLDANVSAVLNFTMKRLDGKPVSLSKYQGKVVVFVNVASQCGLTPQYAGLQKLHEKYAEKGLAIVGVPANEFGQQEPGTNAEIAEFCAKNYGVKFDMLEKVVVNGPGQCALYKHLTSKDTNPKFAGDIKWNFEKFVIGRNGAVVARFASDVEPDDAKFAKAIEEELAKK